MQDHRVSDHPVEPLILARWSPRSFDATSMPERDLLTILEAGRWAPSAFNIQPWRFLYTCRGDAHWRAFLGLLDPSNRAWAGQASALVFLLSDKVMPGDGDRVDRPSRYNSFDTGAAWTLIALQATALGYGAHAMAGLVFSEAANILGSPERFRLEVGIAIGRRADASRLPADLRERETVSGRLPLGDIAISGRFSDRFRPISAE